MERIDQPTSQSIDELQSQMINASIQRVDAVEKKFIDVEAKHKDQIYGFLGDIYKEYHQFKDSPLEEQYFEAVELGLSQKGISVQSDTTHALMLVKTVFEKKNSQKSQLSKYAKSIQLAKLREIEPDKFPEWLAQNGIEKISRNKQKLPKNQSERAALARANLLILQWLEIKDAMPVAITEINRLDLPSATIDTARMEVALCKIRAHPTDPTKALIHTYWILPRTEKNEKDQLSSLAWSILPKLDDLEAMVAAGNQIVFQSEMQRELEYAEEKGLAFEKYLRDCERQNAFDSLTHTGMGNAFMTPYNPPKRK